MRNRSIALSVLVLFALFLMASAAYAVDPQTGPAVIRSVTFEGVNASDTLPVYTTFDPNNTGNPNPPTWAAVTTTHNGGTHAFWCAGSNPASGTSYPAGTRGQAVLWLPDQSQYYQSTINYAYSEPSLGPEDNTLGYNPFLVSWSSGSPTDPTAPGGWSDIFLDRPIAGWKSVTYLRGVSGPPLTAGWLRFQFVSNPSQTFTGQGPAIDDISVTAYEFGPVRSLSALRQQADHTNVNVTWSKPYVAGTTTLDPRTVYYRVWRKDKAASAWTELTSGGAITATTIADTGSAAIDHEYQYAVQAYDSPSNTTQWGLLATPADVYKAIPRFTGIGGSPLSVAFGGATKVTAPLVDEIGAALPSQAGNIVVQRMIAGQGWTDTGAAVSEDSPGTYSATVSSNVNASYRMFYNTTGIGSGSIGVQAVGYLGKPSAPSKVKRKKAFFVKGSANRVPNVSRYVLLKAYHKETKKVGGKKKTVWVFRASAKGKVTAGDGVGSYKASFKVKLAGSWRITASISDAYNPGQTSGLRYFTAK